MKVFKHNPGQGYGRIALEYARDNNLTIVCNEADMQDLESYKINVPLITYDDYFNIFSTNDCLFFHPENRFKNVKAIFVQELFLYNIVEPERKHNEKHI